MRSASLSLRRPAYATTHAPRATPSRNTRASGRVRTARALVFTGFVLLATALVALLVRTVASQRGAEWLLAPAALLGALAVRGAEVFVARLRAAR